MRFTTVEMRWFLPGPLPLAVLDWFGSLGPGLAAPPPRTDRYLLLPGRDDLGIKLREGQLEIKGRTAELGRHRVGARAVGEAEAWCKWSLAPEEVPEALRILDADPDLGLPIHKDRSLRRLVAGESGVRSAPLDLLEGCQVEVTALETPFGVWWTLGLEALVGPEPDLTPLLAIGAHLFRDFPDALGEGDARSYPGWLLAHTP